MPSSLARRLSWTMLRRSASIARLWTMPEHPGAHAAAGAVVAGAGAPEREEGLLDDVLGASRAARHAVGERERGGAVALVDDLEGRGVAAAHAAASGPRRRACGSSCACWPRWFLRRRRADRITRGRGACAVSSADVAQRLLGEVDAAVRRGAAGACAGCADAEQHERRRRRPCRRAAAAGRAQLRGSRIARQLPASSSSAASSVSVCERALQALARSSGGSTGASARRSRPSKSAATCSLIVAHASRRCRRSPRAA